MEYFKWIDTSISRIVEDLFPVSARFSGGVTNVIDSHILERNKYQNKFPITTRYASTEGSAKGQAELNYNWKTGHAPIPSDDNDNCLWQKQRKERSDISDRETIRKSINLHSNTPLPKFAQPDGTIYEGSEYVFRNLSKPYKLEKLLKPTIHGGINYPPDKDRNIIHNFVDRAGEVSPSGVPLNTFLVGQGTGQGIIEKQQCDDILDPNLKKRVQIAKRYIKNFSGFKKEILFPKFSKNNSYFIFQVFFKNKRDEILNILKSENIGVSIHYATPLPKMTYYKKRYNYKRNSFLNADIYGNSNISLPVYPELKMKEVDFICDTIIKFFKNEK